MLPGGVKRNYEVSIWTLQDSFITVLKPANLEFKGQIQDPDMNIKDDGTLTFSFTIPMYLDGGLRENPIWYNTRNGVILADLRKLKVIFNKKQVNEKIFEFLITKVNESHEKGQLMCKVESESLAFHELGHKGLKVSFSLQDYLNDYNEWADSANPRSEEKPVNNLQYWCEKLLANSDWEYDVQMVWPGRSLAENKVFEDEYVSSWALEGDRLVAQSVQDAQEKYRIVEVSDSNLYNITQTIAETFGVYCRYEYEYDNDYHIIGKKIIFFNNFIKEQDGPFDITYPYQTDKISRTMDGTDLCTKLYITSVEDSTAPSGVISISTAAANKTKEDYILNFDYLHKIGTITEEQYAAVSEFEVEVRKINDQLDPLSEEIIELENELVEYEATKKIMDESVTKDREQLNQSQDLLNAITDNRGTVDLTKGNALSGILIEDFNNSTSGNVKYKIRLTTKGILCDSTHPIKVYRTLNDIDLSNTIYERPTTNTNKEIELDYDDYGNIVGLKNIPSSAITNDSYRWYIILSYRPALYNENVYAAFARKLAADTAERQKAAAMVGYLTTKLEGKRALYKTLIANKEKLIADFSNLMGPALREGQWSPDVYKDYGNSSTETLKLHAENPGCFLSFAFDSNYFDGEETLGATYGIDQTTKNYCLIELTPERLSAIQSANAWNDIAFMYSGTEFNANPALDTTYHINSQMFYVFVRDINGISTVPAKPALLITGMTYDDSKWGESSEEKNPRISVKTTKTIEQNNLTNATIEVQEHKIFELTNADIFSGANYILLYPRITIPTLSVKISEDMLKVQLGHQASGFVSDKSLEMYSDYSILIRDDSYVLTLNIQEIMKAYAQYGANIYARVHYSVSNADTSIFLDAREVSQTNAWPQVSYDVAITLLKNGLWEDLYSLIGYIVNINDDELKFENVQGYISEISLKLDAPWNDSVKIKNYKTKFEDLFSTIVASSNIVQANAAIYDRTVSLFNSDGTIKDKVLQTTLNKVNLEYAFRNGELTIDNEQGIWATSAEGVVAFTGGGLFTATEKDANDNWLWNTGIVPSGINASLLNAGQIDTNLIKIFAGNNLRFQLNGDGLFAYAQDTDGTTILDKYVVHDADGLFLRAPLTPSSQANTGEDEPDLVNRVAISWDGLKLKNNRGDTTFYADASNGNLWLSGTVSANNLYVVDSDEDWQNADTTSQRTLINYLLDSQAVNLADTLETTVNNIAQILNYVGHAQNDALEELVRDNEEWQTFAQSVSALSNRTYSGLEHAWNFIAGDVWHRTITLDNTEVSDGTYIAVASWNNIYVADNENEQTAEEVAQNNTTSVTGWVLTNNYQYATLNGSAFNVNAQTGEMQLYAQKSLELYGGTVKIGGTNVYMAANGNADSGLYFTATNYDANTIDSSVATVVITANGINLNTSGTNGISLSTTHLNSSVSNLFKMNPTDGLWLGTNQGIHLYAEDAGNNSAAVAILPDKILFGVGSTTVGTNSNALELTKDYFILAANTIAYADLITSGPSTSVAGVKITSTEIALATSNGSNNNNLIRMNNDGITLGVVGTNLTGSFIQLSSDYLKIGASANININTNNLQIFTDDSYDTSSTDVPNYTHFILGNHLTDDSVADPALWYDKDGLHVKGAITATSLTLGDDVHLDIDAELPTKLQTFNDSHLNNEGYLAWNLRSYSGQDIQPQLYMTADGLTIINCSNDRVYLQPNQIVFQHYDQTTNTGTNLLNFENGNLTITGTIKANAGYIGSANAHWNIGDKSIYNGIASFSSVGSNDGGLYIGTDGISINNLIKMDKNGNFSLYNEYTSTDANRGEIFAIKRINSSSNQYQIVFGTELDFGDFVLPIKNGGTGNQLGTTSIYTATSKANLDAQTAPNGAIGVVYQTGTNTSSSGSLTPNKQTNISFSSTTSKTSQYGQNRYWNHGRLSTNDSSYLRVIDGSLSSQTDRYARLGAGNTSSKNSAIVIPFTFTVSGNNFTSIEVSYSWSTNPNASATAAPEDYNTAVTQPTYIHLWKGQATDITQNAGNFNPNVTSSAAYGASGTASHILVTLTEPLQANTTYYLTFYTTAIKSLYFIKVDTITIHSQTASSGSSNTASLYVRSAGEWIKPI